MSEGFTPGPWTVVDHPEGDGFYVDKHYFGDGTSTVCGEYTLAHVTSDGWLPVVGNKIDGSGAANARLIAAAPELVATVANAAGSFLAVMEYLSGVCIHKAGTGRDCYPCDAYDSARKGLEAAQAMLARIRGEG